MDEFELEVSENHLDEENVRRTSLVDKPATHKLFAVFSEENNEVTQKFTVLPTRENQQMVKPTDNKFERIISGVWFMPDVDYPRQRVDEETGETILFTSSMTKDQLMLAVKNFVKSGRMNEFDIMHNGDLIKGLRTIEVWMLYDYAQLSPVLLNNIEELGYTIDEIPLGTVFMTVFIENEEFFNEYILSGKLKGFSIEGLFDIKLKEITEMEVKQKEMFNSLGLEQVTGTLITLDGKLKFEKDCIKLEDNKITEGSFKLANKFSIEVRDSKVVDFGFEEVVIEEPIVETKEVEVTEVKTEEVVTETTETKEEVIVEDKVETKVEEKVKSETTTEVKEVKEEVDTSKDDLIKDLQDKLRAETLAKETALKSLPIAKGKKPKIEFNPNTHTKKIVGGKEHIIPKLN